MDEQVPGPGVNLVKSSVNLFEELKQVNEHGAEYWRARDLCPHLGYTNWSNFKKAVKKAVNSCEQSGNDPHHHFAEASKMIQIGKGGVRQVDDLDLSRFACYLIAQNGDPKKPQIANAQKYFAIQTRRQELSDQLAADRERLELREQHTEEFKALCGAARQAGVQSAMFGVFHDAGYKGMYGGRGRDAIKHRKGIPEKDDLMDRMGTTELAANNFRLTQTRDKLSRDAVSDQQRAIRTHEQVGREVREAIRKIGGTMPEDIPAAEHVRHVKKRIKAAKPQLVLDERDALGLVGGAEPQGLPEGYEDI
ncbi:MAG TPA: DNA damage-inducible protein D [Pirellulales bacterium]|nr:DNA damage-inducible protein D [Pirellulales bacterium]